MKKLFILSQFLLFMISMPLTAIENLPLHLKIMSTHKAVEPQIWNNNIFLTAAPEKRTNFVGVAFDYESYSVIHPYEINESGVFIYSAGAPDKREIRYRLIIDGLWMADPLNNENIKDEYGILVSILHTEEPSFIHVKGPVSDENGKTVFTIRSTPDSTVSIVGTFNGWDPYMTPMKERSPGVYIADVKLRDGAYYYYFIIDGEKAMDPMNFARARNREGEEVCRINILGS